MWSDRLSVMNPLFFGVFLSSRDLKESEALRPRTIRVSLILRSVDEEPILASS
jgi:hypothetical protein